MQNTEQLMSYKDLLNFANELARKINEPLIKKLQEVEEKLNNLEASEKKPEKLILSNAKEVAECLGVSVWQARDLMRHPTFPKPITKRTGKYNKGKWRANEVKRAYQINLGKM